MLGTDIAQPDSITKNARAMAAADLLQLLSILVICVEHRRSRPLGAATFKQPSLRRKVIFHRAVVIQMVAGQIGKYRNIKWHPENTLLLECVRGNFHHHFGRALS